MFLRHSFFTFLNCVSLELRNLKLQKSRRAFTHKSHCNTVPKIMFSLHFSFENFAHKVKSAFKRLGSNIWLERHVGKETGGPYRQEFTERSMYTSNTTIVYRYSTR